MQNNQSPNKRGKTYLIKLTKSEFNCSESPKAFEHHNSFYSLSSQCSQKCISNLEHLDSFEILNLKNSLYLLGISSSPGQQESIFLYKLYKGTFRKITRIQLNTKNKMKLICAEYENPWNLLFSEYLAYGQFFPKSFPVSNILQKKNHPGKEGTDPNEHCLYAEFRSFYRVP